MYEAEEVKQIISRPDISGNYGTGAAITFEYTAQCLWRVFENTEKTPVKAARIREIIKIYSIIV